MATAWVNQKRRWAARAWMHPEPARPDLRQVYGDWLGALPWDWYGTFTFAQPIYPDQAGHRYERWAELLQQELGWVMQHARALEWQRRGVVHFHALILGVRKQTNRKEWERKWEEIGGGFAAIFPYDRELGAVYYLGKYLVKNGEVDMLRFGKLRGRPDDVRLTQPGPG